MFKILCHNFWDCSKFDLHFLHFLTVDWFTYCRPVKNFIKHCCYRQLKPWNWQLKWKYIIFKVGFLFLFYFISLSLLVEISSCVEELSAVREFYLHIFVSTSTINSLETLLQQSVPVSAVYKASWHFKPLLTLNEPCRFRMLQMMVN